MKDIVIYGGGGFAREVLQIILDINDEAPQWNVLGFLVDAQYRDADDIHGLPVLGGADWIAGKSGLSVVVANGLSAQRRAMVEQLKKIGKPAFPTLVHPRAWLGRRNSLAEGCVICAGVSLTTDVRLGQHVHINLNCTVGHDAVLGDFVTLSPLVGVSGNVEIGALSEVMTGCTLIPKIRVGRGVLLGAGAVASKDIPDNVLAVGVPARVVKELTDRD